MHDSYSPNLLSSRQIAPNYAFHYAPNFLNTRKGKIYKAINVFSMSLLVLNMSFGMALGGIFMVAPGEAWACHGTITVIKQTVPDGDTQAFAFSKNKTGKTGWNGNFSLIDGNSVDLPFTSTGDYYITEADVPGWNLSDIVCSGNNSNFTVTKYLSERKVKLKISHDTQITCTFTNTKEEVKDECKDVLGSDYFSVAKWEYAGAWSEAMDKHDPAYSTAVSGNNESADWTSNPAVDKILRKAATTYTEFPGGTSGTVTKDVNSISHITFCGGPGECKLELVKTDSPDPVAPGGDLTYNLTLTNTGTANCTGSGVELKEFYDSKTSFVSSVPNPASGNNVWVKNVLAPGESYTVDILTTVKTETACGSEIVNEACAWAEQLGSKSNPDNWICATATTTVECPPVCGDGIKNGDEQCDDGKNGDNTDGCTDQCTLTYCGDSTIQTPNGYGINEVCDDNGQNGVPCVPAYNSTCTYCSSTCQPTTLTGPYSGGGVQNGLEACDDGKDGDNTDGCTDQCALTYCGDSTIQTPNGYDLNEVCDRGGQNGLPCVPDYDSTCTYCSGTCSEISLRGPYCGDGIIQGGEGEECDWPAMPTGLSGNWTCESDCKLKYIPPKKGWLTVCKWFDVDGLTSTIDDQTIVPGWNFTLDHTTTQTTGDNGCTVFTDLDPKQYTVSETMPNPSWSPVYPENGEGTVIVDEDQGATINFYNTRRGGFTICKYYDNGVIGAYESGVDTPLAWEFTVTGPDSYSQTLNTSNDNACVSVDNLIYGDYTITEAPVSGHWRNTYPANGSYSFTLGSVALQPFVFLNYEAPFCGDYNPDPGEECDHGPTGSATCSTECKTIEQCTSLISGRKLDYFTGNGLSGWVIELRNDNLGIVYATTTTDNDGNYAFNDLCTGRYDVYEQNQSGWTQVSPIDPDNYYTIFITTQNTNETDKDFVNRHEVGNLKICKIGDSDGDLNTADDQYPVADWPFTVTYPDQSAHTVRTAGEIGCVTLSDLPIGIYNAAEAALTKGWIILSPENGATSTEVKAGETAELYFYNRPYGDSGMICGYKYEDEDKNAATPNTKGLPDWTIELSTAADCAAGENWADRVINYTQGTDSNSDPLASDYTDSAKALGEAEADQTLNYVSLGFGGEIILELENIVINGNGADIEIFETSPDGAPTSEKARVYASPTGIDGTWRELGLATLDTSLDLGTLVWAKYIKLVDESDDNDENADGNGYDLDGLFAVNCRADWQKVTAPVLTDSTGRYCFQGLPYDAAYRVNEVLKTNWHNTTPLYFDVWLEYTGKDGLDYNFNNYYEEGPRCGDRILGNTPGEQCDDGNNVSGDGCSATCSTEGGGGPYCGDGII